ncbi:MAG: hypothetical protein ACI89X_001029 [Planctomycetota bacterium]|jgi:hypothetical protein
MARPQLLTCALFFTLASCASTAPTTLVGPAADIPVFASDDARVGTAGFVGQTLRLKQEHEGITYTLMAFVVGDTLTLGAMVKGKFAGDVQWSIGNHQLTFPFDSAAVQSGAIVSVSHDSETKLKGEGAAFRGTSWMNVDLPLADWAANGTALQLKFAAHDGATRTLPDAGYHYVVQLTPRP